MNAHNLKATLMKTRIFTAIVIVSNVLGNLSLSLGLRRVGSLIAKPPVAYIEALFNPWVAAGVTLLILWLLSHMALLSWADLSYVLPVTSLGYALAAVSGKLFFHEYVSWPRWGGIALIMLGVAMVGRTAHSTKAAQ